MSALATTLMHHAGPFTQDVVIARGRELRALPGLSENGRHRLFAAFVELGQNIARYSAIRAGAPGEERGSGAITVAASPEGHILLRSTNPVAAPAAAALRAQLETLSGLDAEALRRLHRDRRRGPPPPGSVGAGLGLIELARQAAGPLGHEATPRPDGLLDFTLAVPLAP